MALSEAAEPIAPNVAQSRIEAMFRGDRLWAYGFVVALWCVYAFVFFAINQINNDSNITIVMAIAGALVLIYNTASITAMVRHYQQDKAYIYGLDIGHLDEMRADKSARHHIE